MSDRRQANRHLRKNTISGSVGNVLEWYDFAVFGYFAPIIGAQFFPSEDKLVSIISAFGVFAAGYLVRPLGGMAFGFIGDRLGRKKALQLSVAMMAFPTVLIGFLPTYAQVGVTAAVLLVALRLIQGISVGGELIGSISFITEMAPANRRGLYGSWSMFSAILGVLLGSLVATMIHGMLADQQVHDWGWRIPFLAGFLIAGFGIWMRKGMVETPVFEQQKSGGGLERNPVSTAIRQQLPQILHVTALVVLMGAGFYMLFVWWPAYLTKIVTPSVPHALMVNTISMVVLVCAIPLMGLASDHYGRRKILLASAAGVVLSAYPLFTWVDHGTVAGALTAQLIFALLIAGIQGPMSATMVELFPTKTRFSGIAIGYNVSLAVFGGTAPLVSTWLISRTGDLASPAYYLMALAMTTMIAAWLIRTKAGADLS